MSKRLPIAIAFSAALAAAGGAGLLHLTQQHEGLGTTDHIPDAGEMVPDHSVDANKKAADHVEDHLAMVRQQTIAITHAYPDPGYGWKVPTICYGHTLGVAQGLTATLGQCGQWLREDYERLVKPALERCVTVEVTVNEAAALADFVFNIGGTRFCSSTLVRKLNADDRAGAADEFLRWNKSNGKVLPGLVKRRAAERALFLEDSE